MELLAKMEPEDSVVRLDLLDAQVKLVLLDPQGPLERRVPPVLMELLYVFFLTKVITHYILLF